MITVDKLDVRVFQEVNILLKAMCIYFLHHDTFI